MKNILYYRRGLLIILSSIAITLVACKKYKAVANDAYPGQGIYLPAAANGFFLINSVDSVAIPTGSVPTPGQASRYQVDISAGNFIVPLAVYRSGVNNDGGVKVNISVNTDTVNKLIAAGTLMNTDLLPDGKYSLPGSVDISGGQEIATFDLTVDLALLQNSYPDRKFALGITISSTDRNVDSALGTAIVVIDTKIMKPTSDFAYSTDASDSSGRTIDFVNNSLNDVSDTWDFGDGSGPSSTRTPIHTYNSAGTYAVKLTTTGIANDVSTLILAVPIP